MSRDGKHRKNHQTRSSLKPRKPPDWGNTLRPDDDLPKHDPSGKPYPAVRPKDLPADIVLPRLQRLRGAGPTWSACCPAHCDSTPSLSVTETHDCKLLVYCHYGCDAEAIMSAIGLDMSFLYPSAFALMFGDRRGRNAPRTRGGGPDGPYVDPEVDYTRFKRIMKNTRATKQRLAELARNLGLPAASLAALEVGYHHEKESWVFPERDWEGRVVGVTYRSASGYKICEKGSTRGLTIPLGVEVVDEGPIYLPEGASDTAALHSVGAFAVGRPAAQVSQVTQRWLGRFLRNYEGRDIVVICDRDEKKNGRLVGLNGAKMLELFLTLHLERPIQLSLPARGYKDVRDQVTAGEWERGLCPVEDTES